ncbi:MAG: NAD(P)(+) transhydrogenase (Re/Si-specific) subunit beta [Actinomycetota bacterium]|nr:NAD(P)(+) transhydrogenase (Re/Si-specific) subunit beta [Actinomycetota bacterium]
MEQIATFVAYLVAAALFVTGIRRLREPETARSGNTLAALGMIIALVATLFVSEFRPGFINALGIGVGVLLGTILGAFSAQRVPLTAMPQMVATFNGLGGGCIALVAVSEFYQGRATSWVAVITGLFTVIIGSISFSGSIVAVSKLQEFAFSGSVTFPAQQVVNALVFLGILALSANVLAGGAIAGAIGLSSLLTPLVSIIAILVASLLLGFLFVIPIGGADMPVVISLLNAFTGLAAAASGFVLNNYALLIGGTLVGASGTILTRLMSSSLGRPLGSIIFQGIVAAGQDEEQEEREVNEASAEDVGSFLKNEAEKVVIVPGYGLAAAQAQNAMHDLMQTLESEGKEVKFGIHPVAGRMPGHMNVLLTEADVPYEKLYDMEDINPEFDETDAVIVVGANDVVNPVARDTERQSAISGMPILDVDHAKRVVFVKRSLSPGFAGVDNELFYDQDRTMMLFSDANQGLQDIAEAVKNA